MLLYNDKVKNKTLCFIPGNSFSFRVQGQMNSLKHLEIFVPLTVQPNDLTVIYIFKIAGNYDMDFSKTIQFDLLYLNLNVRTS